jgi:hypothetical protein
MPRRADEDPGAAAPGSCDCRLSASNDATCRLNCDAATDACTNDCRL